MPRSLQLLCAALLAAGCVSAVSKSPAVTQTDAAAAPAAGDDGPPARTDGPATDGPDRDTTTDAAADRTPDTATDAEPPKPPTKLALGQPCGVDDECGSTHCVSRVCCATTCPAGAPPCGQDGSCDGNGRCRVPSTDVACGEDKCASGTFTPAPHCDGAGRCGTSAPVACASNACQGARCAGSCPGTPCPDGLYCAANGQCQPKKAAGTKCDADAECGTGHCAEHVCCDTGCGGACQSCLATYTGGRDGACLPIKAGTDPYDSCQAALPTTCLNDGWCDGKGGCEQHANGTPCRTETCVDGAGGSAYTPGGTCNGTGRCVDSGSGKMCDPYVCGGSKCKGSCTTRSDCKTGYYCTFPTCTQQKANGTICSGPDECTSGFCGGSEPGGHSGRCCPSCSCPQPTAGNLLAQPGLDANPGFGSASPWQRYLTSTPSGNANIVWIGSYDRDGCPYSGAMDVMLGDQKNGIFYQCVPATANQMYYFGGQFRAPAVPEKFGGTPWQAYCSIVFYTSMSGCRDNSQNRFMGRAETERHDVSLWENYATANVWEPFSSFATAPSGAHAAALECEGLDDGAPVTELLFDKLWLTTGTPQF
jgi:hypothetical protein